MRVAIINAYSSHNHGDGLLVELAHNLVRESFQGKGDVQVTVFALDPESFKGRSFAIDRPHRFRGRLGMIVSGALAIATRGRVGMNPRMVQAVRSADITISVGGGYLRGATASETLGAILAHVSQLHVARTFARDHVMLPQSIGPFHRLVWPLIGSAMSRTRIIAVRDDRSLAQVPHRLEPVRFPDCALLGLDAAGPQRSTASGVGLIVRDLPRPKDYWRVLDELVRRLAIVPVLQSTGRGNDDHDAYARLGLPEPTKTVDSACRSDELECVVSVRLHGAIMSILAGVPAVHLSYERKGFSAFEDLGLADYVFDARTADSEAVLQAVARISDDPSQYWDRVNAALPALVAARRNLIAALA